MRILFWLCLVLYLVVFAQPYFVSAQTPAPALSLAQYQAHLTQAAQKLEQGNDSMTVVAVQKTLAAIQNVRLPSGQLITVQPLLGSSDSTPPAPDVALVRVRLVIDQLNASVHDDTAARLALLQEVLNQPAFNTPVSLWERLLRWLRSLLPTASDNVPSESAAAASQFITWLVAGIGGILLIFLLSYWLQGLLGSFVADVEARRRAENGEALPLTANAARQQATALARRGNYRDAVRQLYLSALLSLEERNLITYDRSLTNREVLAQMRNRPTVQNHLKPVVETFDNVWYGIQEPDQATFTAYEREIDQLTAQVQDDKTRG